MVDNNKKKYIKYEDTTYILQDSRIPDPSAADNGKVLGVINGEYALKQEEGGGGAVTSVNGKTGAVNLSASDVHALPDSTVIPTVPQMATDPDMTDWTTGKTVDAAVLATDLEVVGQVLSAKYTKPSGGIPASDLAADVQTSLGKADTALQEHQSLSGYATESWVQNQGYLTQHQDISGKQDKTITDTGGYYTTDTVEGALQEIGAELASASSASVPRIAKTASDTTATIEPNKLYVFPEMASLTITLAAIADNTIVNEYHFVFDSGSTATVLTLPASVLQPDGFSVEANMHYEISILEGAMTAQGWAVTA